MRRRKKNNLYKVLFLLLLCLGIGYAALTTNLSINGTANVPNAAWDIHFANLVVNQNSTATVDQAATIDSDTAVSYEITMSQPGEFYEFNVDVVNGGTIDGMIESVTSKMNNTLITTLPNYLEYSITYSDDIVIAPNQLLEAGNSETYKIRVGYKRDITPGDLPSTDQTLHFNFEVIYVQADENGVPKPMQPIIQPVNGQFETTTFRSSTYKNNIKIINLDDEINPPANVIESWDIGVAQNGNVMAYITANADDNTKYDLYIQGDGALYANPDSSYLFYGLRGVDAINNIDVLNTSKVQLMADMFSYTGYTSTVFTLDLGDNFDTSNVTDMSGMFANAGKSSTVFTLDLGDKFDTSKVTTMQSLFAVIGYNNTTFTLDLGDKFDTRNVTNMSGMFNATGYKSTVFTLDLGDKFDTSKVTNMSYMFYEAGYSSTILTLDLGNKFDTSKVTNMSVMFRAVGYSSPVFTLNLGNKFDTSNVTNMGWMFEYVGYRSTIFTLDLGDKFDTSKVTNMTLMFDGTGRSSPVFTLDLGDKFATSIVTDMYNMFNNTGYSNSTFELDLSTFDFSSVTNYSGIFGGFRTTQKIYVKNASDQNWIITNGGNSNLTTSNVLIKT